MLGDIRHAVAHGFDALGENFIGVDRGGRDHLLDVRVIEQRAMMHNAVAQTVLRVAGKLPAVDQQIVAAIEAGIRAQLAHGVHDGTDILREFNLLLRRVLNERELPAAEIGVDRPAAGHTAHEMDPVRVGIRLVDLFENILVLADHQRRRCAPEEENRIGQALFRGKIVLKAKIIVNVGQTEAYCIEKGCVLDDMPLDAYKQFCSLFEDDLYDEISLENCVAKRISKGGTGFASEIGRAHV